MRGKQGTSTTRRYLAALLVPLAVSGLMQLTWPFFEQSPVSLFLIAATFCAWHGGLGPGLLSVFISFLLADYFFVTPYFALWPPRRADLVYLVTLTGIGAVISALSELMHRARRRVEINRDSIKQSEEMYRSLLNATSEVVWTTDVEGRIRSGAPGWSAVTGQSPAESLGTGWLDALHPDDRCRFSDVWSAALEGKTSYETEARIREIGGPYRSFRIRGVPTREEDGSINGWIKSASDVTQRKLAEDRFRLVVEASPSALLTVDESGCITLVNSQAEQLFGYTRDEMLGGPIEMLVPERFRGAHPGHRVGFFATPSVRAMGAGRDLYGLRKDGSEVPIEIGLNPLTTPEGSFVLASIIDITERKRADERFRLIIEHAPYGKVLVDQQGRISLVNSHIEKCFGYTREELLGQPIEMLVPPRFHAHHPAQRDHFIAQPIARPMGAGRELYGLRKDGSEFPVEIGLNPLETEQGPMILGTIVDITERKRSEEALQATQERLSFVLQQSHTGGWDLDLTDNTAYRTLEHDRIFGYDELRPEWTYEIFLEHVLPEDRAEVDKSFRQAITAQRDWSFECRIRRADGEVRWIWAAGGHQSDAGVPARRMAGVVQDITERKHAEEKLRRSQQQLAGVISSAMDAIITADHEQRIVLFNGAAERMFLFPSEDAIGQPLDRFIPERFRAAHKDHIKDFGETKVTKRSMGTLGPLYGLRADGEEFPIEASISQIQCEGRKVYTVILRDISDRKRADEALKEQARILDLAPVLIREPNGRIVFWNAGAEEMYGWTTEEALDKISHRLLRSEFPRPIEEIKAKLYAQNHWEGEVVHIRKDGERIIVASHWVVHRDEDNKPKAVLEVNNDITERKQAEQEILRLNAELEQRVTERTAQLQAVNKELEAFSYSVSHDLRAPLRHIDGFSQALLEDYTDRLDDTGKSYLREVRSASQEMAQLIDDVLQLARVTRSEMRREVVNLSDLVGAITVELKKREPARNVSLNLKKRLETRGDKRLLRIVLNNLLGNAWKFTSGRAEAEITFGGEQKNGETTYFIRDNGAGFDMAYVGKLFGAFQRLHTAGEFEGTGIGLATVQRIVYRHGGRVWAEGAVNEGATFYFTLPDFKETGTGDAKQSDSTG